MIVLTIISSLIHLT